MARVKNNSSVEFPFFIYLQTFIEQEHKKIYAQLKPLTKKFLNYNNAKENQSAFLRKPQFEALEVYVFLKEACQNKKLWEIYDEWYKRTDIFADRSTVGVNRSGQLELFSPQEINQEEDLALYKKVYEQIKSMGQDYPNYIFALTMGLGKTVLMATSIFYEFLLANKYPNDSLYCHNALVFAPDKTVLQSLREIQTFDKSKVIPPEYLSWLDANLKFHFLDDTSTSLSTIDQSDYNIIITNTQKIILKKEHVKKTPVQTLFGEQSGKYTALTLGLLEKAGQEAGVSDDDLSLITNSRFQKLARLKQMGIYVDEAHHVFGSKLSEDLMTTTKATSLRVTINELAANLAQSGTKVVACYNYTGTPYVNNRLLPEVVYAYGLREAIENGYLKKVEPYPYENIREQTLAFCRSVVEDFWKKLGTKRFEGMLPKMAFFASDIAEANKDLRPALEKALIEKGIDTEKILINVGDTTITTNDDLREFNNLDSAASNKQFIILVGKGKEGWNCRSLFAVAMHRQAKSTVFVLQATMRCLRQIGDYQPTAYLYLSQENINILNKELEQNFNISLDDMTGAGKDNNFAEVRLVPPPIKVKVKRTQKLFRLKEKQLAEHVDLKLAGADVERYKMTRYRSTIEDLSKKTGPVEDVSRFKDRIHYSQLTLVAEIARYLNMSPIRIREILESSKEGMRGVIDSVNEYNELLYDVVIPNLFHEMYDITEYEQSEDVELELVKEPAGGFYQIKYKSGLLASLSDDTYKSYKDKTFNVDNYCFDSNPEKEMFWNLIHDKRLEKVWFTGMFTRGQTEFLINYIDPESNGVRSYYPDFLVKKADGSYIIIEVKGDNKIEDSVVLAKQEYARKMAIASNMQYIMIPGTKAGEKLNI